MAQTKSLDLESTSSQYAYITDNASISPTGSITIEGMVNWESLPADTFDRTILGKWGSTANKRSYWFSIRNVSGTYYLRGGISSDGTYQSGNDKTFAITIPTSRWVHYAFVFDSSVPSFKFYVNGRLVSTQTVSNNSIHNNDSRLSIGAIDSESSAAQFGDGKYKNIRLWNVARTQKEIIQFMGTTAVGETGLVSEWRFEDDYTDSQGNNDLTASGSPVFATDVPNTLGMKDVANWTQLGSIEIDVTALSLSGALDYYPITLQSNQLGDAYASLESDGKDLRFTSDEDGLYELPYELVSIDTGAETCEVHLLIPTLATTTTTVYVWGSYSSAVAYAVTDIMGAQSVWKTEYKGVWHLDEASGTRTDSTANDNDLTDNNTVTQGTGKIGSGADFELSASEYLSKADNNSLDITGDLHVSTWLNLESAPGNNVNYSIAGKTSFGGTNAAWYLRYRNDAGTPKLQLFTFNSATTNQDILAINYTFSTATLYKLDVVFDASAATAKFYINGVQQGGNQTGTNTDIKNSTAPFLMGARVDDPSTYSTFWDGIFDEFRLAAIDQSADWIKADYNLQNAPDTYMTFTGAGGGSTGMFLTM